MVGIILASHGDFAKGILQSGTMIFGEQEKVVAVTLDPSEGPENFRSKLETAIQSFGEDSEVLFLIDLWGGTPFNQANGLLEGEKDKYAIVTGLNLPMLIEAFSARSSADSSHTIAAHILEVAQEGIKVKPESIAPVATSVNASKRNTGGAIPEGTVIGDGKIKIVLARVDSRLLHGQVATAWTKSVNPDRIIVVSDAVAKDDLRRKLIEQAAPPGVKAHVIPKNKMIAIAKDPRFGGMKAMLLFENPEDAAEVIDAGVDVKELNVGSMAHSEGKAMVNKVLAMDQTDIDTFNHLHNKGITFDVRKVPNDNKGNMAELLKKAQEELTKQ